LTVGVETAGVEITGAVTEGRVACGVWRTPPDEPHPPAVSVIVTASETRAAVDRHL
jgi:hypothetical protein